MIIIIITNGEGEEESRNLKFHAQSRRQGLLCTCILCCNTTHIRLDKLEQINFKADFLINKNKKKYFYH